MWYPRNAYRSYTSCTTGAGSSVTRFGEISPHWKILNCHWPFLGVEIWQFGKICLIWQFFNAFGQIDIVVNAQILNK